MFVGEIWRWYVECVCFFFDDFHTLNIFMWFSNAWEGW